MYNPLYMCGVIFLKKRYNIIVLLLEEERMGKYFGTDGFRGEAGVNLTSEHAYKIGRFLGWYYGDNSGEHKVRVVIGKDTRLSSYMFEYAIVAGLTASGADAYMLHVTTTPSVSYITRQDEFDCGIMISASHNPFYDNGIKIVNRYGEKFDDKTTAKIEQYLDGDLKGLGLDGDIPFASGDKIGKSIDYSSGRNRYIGSLISLSANSFRGLKIALDCANGSAWMIAKNVFETLGANTYVINANPSGTNINMDAGSTHIEGLQKYVKENALDMGFAFDGDADRCLAVDENGNLINGDHILYIFGKYLKDKGALNGNTVVTTIMSNMGLYKALEEAGINYTQTTVGDRFVYENMVENGYNVGGEQSGHIILSKYATTGDGILTAIKLTDACLKYKLTLSKLAEPVKMFPQVLKNVRVNDKAAVRENELVKSAIKKVEDALGSSGRILLRESGTEPVIRVMVEAESEKLCEQYVDEVVAVINSIL